MLDADSHNVPLHPHKAPIVKAKQRAMGPFFRQSRACCCSQTTSGSRAAGCIKQQDITDCRLFEVSIAEALASWRKTVTTQNGKPKPSKNIETTCHNPEQHFAMVSPCFQQLIATTRKPNQAQSHLCLFASRVVFSPIP